MESKPTRCTLDILGVFQSRGFLQQTASARRRNGARWVRRNGQDEAVKKRS